MWILIPVFVSLTFHQSYATSLRIEGEKQIVISSSSNRQGRVSVNAHTFIFTKGVVHSGRDKEQPRVLRIENVSNTTNAIRYNAGLHLYIFNQRTGRVICERRFQSYEAFSWWADLIWWLQQTAPGRLVVMTVSGFGNTLGLRRARTLFSDLGSVFAHYLSITSCWTWAFIQGGRTLYETINKGSYITQELFSLELCSSKVIAEGILELSTLPLPTSENRVSRERWMYCSHEGGMGDLCDEYPNPSPTEFPSSTTLRPSAEAVVEGLRVVLIAGNRHQYLYKTLRTLLAIPGANKENVIVALGDSTPSTTALLQLLNVNYTSFSLSGEGNSKLFQFYRNVYKFINETLSDFPAVVILEEDVEVSPDFFNFISETLWVLFQDPTLYCINGFSILPNVERGRGEHFVRRGAMQVTWGYAVTTDFVREALHVWPNVSDHEDILVYDYWLYDKVRGDRECIYPEVSRIRHYGLGINTEPSMHEFDAWYRPLLNDSNISIQNSIEMLLSNHEDKFIHDLQRATVAGPIDPCGSSFPPQAENSKVPFVLYFSQEEEDDVSSWYILGQCVGLNAVSEQGNHNGAHFAYFPAREQEVPLQSRDASFKLSNQSKDMRDSWHPNYPQNYKPPFHFPLGPQDVYGMNYYTPREESITVSSVLVYFVGYPYSKYSILKPTHAFVYDASQFTEEDEEMYRQMFLHTTDILMLDSSIYTYANLMKSMFNSD